MRQALAALAGSVLCRACSSSPILFFSFLFVHSITLVRNFFLSFPKFCSNFFILRIFFIIFFDLSSKFVDYLLLSIFFIPISVAYNFLYFKLFFAKFLSKYVKFFYKIFFLILVTNVCFHFFLPRYFCVLFFFHKVL